MIDLHLHLDGSLSPSEIKRLAALSGAPLPSEKEEELLSLMRAKNGGSLNDYLKKFELPLSVLQSGEAVELAVTLLSRRLKKMLFAYAEVRFAPLLHLSRGADMKDIVLGALRGRANSPFPLNIILCCMRGADRELNIRTVELAAELKNEGVCGVDLAGAEALYPTENYKDVFALAQKEKLNVTVHAGEAAGQDSVRAALDMGAKRIGHGVAAAGDESLLRRFRAEWITVEACPTSNVQTGAVKSIASHPILKFLRRGVPCALCADNMTVSDTSVFREWEKVKDTFGFGEFEKKELLAAAEMGAFRK